MKTNFYRLFAFALSTRYQISTKIFSSQMATSSSTSNTKKQLKIDIVSDNVCPWCYVGKRRLEKALSQLDSSKVNVEISWYPFELDSGSPREGSILKLDRYKQKFGEERTKQMITQMQQTGKEEGIQFSYGGKVGSTFNSHRLVHYAKLHGNKQNELIAIIFKYYFEQEKDINDLNVLCDCAQEVGYDRQEIMDFLKSNKYEQEIQNEVERNYQQGITGVPHFTINGRYSVSGAQTPEHFMKLFSQAGII